MKTTIRVEGLAELDTALGELPRAVAKNVLRRVLIKAGEPIAAAAREMAPKDTGELAQSIIVSSKVKNTVGNAEYNEVMRNFGTQQEAVQAMRDARRADSGGNSLVQMYVGPAKATTKKAAIKRIVMEFGSVDQAPHPYMRPAWEANKSQALDIIKAELGSEIEKAAKRVAKRAAAKAAKAAANG